MKNGRYCNFRDICDRNLWDTGYLVKKLQGYGILRPPLMGPQSLLAGNGASVTCLRESVSQCSDLCNAARGSEFLAIAGYKGTI